MPPPINRFELHAIDNDESFLDQAAGAAVAVELRVRIFAERSADIQAEVEKVKEEVVEKKKHRASKGNRPSDRYWNCKLEYLEDAVEKVYSDCLSDADMDKLKKARLVRNNLLHADFVSAQTLLGISPAGREIRNGQRVELERPEKC